jgi:N4-gp56 family major capsid protein
MTTNTYVDVQDATRAHLVTEFLKRAAHEDVIGQFSVPFVMPQKRTLVAEWTRCEALPNAVKELQEGVTPAGSKPIFTKVKTELKQIGDHVEFTDVLEAATELDVLGQYKEVLGQQGGEMAERHRLEVARSCSNRFFAGSATSIGTVALSRVERALDRQKARTIGRAMKAGVNIETKPIPKSFIAICHTDLRKSLNDMNATAAKSFIPVHEYSGMDTFETEMGSSGRIRFLGSTLLEPLADAGGSAAGTYISTSGTSCDVYPIIILGEEAFASARLAGFDAADILVAPPRPQSGDPLAQRGTIGWKSWVGAAILNDLWMAVLYVAVKV